MRSQSKTGTERPLKEESKCEGLHYIESLMVEKSQFSVIEWKGLSI